MKKDTDDLYELINSLTVAEKRYCSLYLKKHVSGRENNYLKLFNCLKKQHEYNPEHAIRKMGFRENSNHYSVLKRQLHQQILDAIYQFSLFTNTEEQLMKGIYQCTWLIKRGLFLQSEKMIIHLEKTAVAMDAIVAQLGIQGLKLSLLQRRGFSNVKNTELDSWNRQNAVILDALKANTRYAYLGAQVHRDQTELGFYNEKLIARTKKIIELPEFQDGKSAPTLHSKIYFYNIKGTYYLQANRLEQAMACFEEIILLLENNLYMREWGASYRIILANYLGVCIKLKKYGPFEAGLKKLRNLPKISISWNIEKESAAPAIFSLSYCLEMDYFAETGKFATAYSKIKLVNDGLKKYGSRINKLDYVALVYAMAYVCFALGKYNQALDHLIPFIQEGDLEVNIVLQHAARLIQLLCHFELGDKMLLESLVKSLQRKIRGMDETADVLRAVLSFVNRSVHKNNIGVGDWIKLQNTLNDIKEKNTSPGFLASFNYHAWVMMHTDGIKFSEYRDIEKEKMALAFKVA
jgi:tetratricopeptide (TPR) repeat protein